MWIILYNSPSFLSSVKLTVADRRPRASLKGGFCLFPISHDFRRKAPSSTSSSSSRVGVRAAGTQPSSSTLRTCRYCKQAFDPEINHPRACRFHTAHFGGETKRKFESVYTGGTMDTIGGGEIVEYWHCCGSKDRFDPGCEAAPHASYDD